MSVRLRRLKSDYDRITAAFSGDSRIRVLETVGMPPEKYLIEYLVTSLQKNLNEQRLRVHNSFVVEVTLTGAYPRLAPQCKMRTPVFHPNIAPHAICIGDHWAAGESLLNLLVRIGEMLAYQSYNVKSPLNGEAARWAEKNSQRLPFDTFDFSTFLSVGEVAKRQNDQGHTNIGSCANCGKAAHSEPLHVCSNDHAACSDCILTCDVCGATLCLKCDMRKCAVSSATLCSHCAYECSACKRVVGVNQTGICSVCNKTRCTDCLVECDSCGKVACIEHISKRVVDGEKKYFCVNCS